MRSHGSRTLRAPRLALALVLAACGADAARGSGRSAAHEQAAHAGAAANVVRRCNSRLDCQGGAAPETCVLAERRCVSLLSDDCRTLTGPTDRDDAIVLGSLFSTSGLQARSNLARENSAVLAVETINALGGVPRADTTQAARPLLLVSCDATAEPLRAAQHLIRDLGVAALIGPDGSQDTLDVAIKLSIAAGTLLLSPTAVAGSIADLQDDDLTFQLAPSDTQRADLMMGEIHRLEAVLSRARPERPLQLGVVFRNDAFGVGTRTSLNRLAFHGKPLSAPGNLNGSVRIDGYDVDRADQQPLVQSYLEFAPDIVVLIGAADAISLFLAPLEVGWGSTAATSGRPRPYYVVTEASQVSELLERADGDPDLRTRLTGTGVRPSASSRSIYAAFLAEYEARFGEPAQSSGMGPSYDAVNALALALAAVGDGEATGRTLAHALRGLAAGSVSLPLQRDALAEGMVRLARGEGIEALGTFGPLRWNMDGAIAAGTLELWCIGQSDGHAAFRSAGLSLDVETQLLAGSFLGCGPQQRPAASEAELATVPVGVAGAAPMGATPGQQPSAMPDTAQLLAAGAAVGAPAPNDAQTAGTGAAGGRNAPAADSGGQGASPTPLTISVHIDSIWAGGRCDTVTVRNDSALARDWIVVLMLDGAMTSYWNTLPAGFLGVVTFFGVDWNRTLEPGASTQFGYCIATE